MRALRLVLLSQAAEGMVRGSGGRERRGQETGALWGAGPPKDPTLPFSRTFSQARGPWPYHREN